MEVSSNRFVLRSEGISFSLEDWPSSISVHPGDQVFVYAEFELPEPPRNPHDFDETKFVRSMGWIGSIVRLSDIVVEHSHGNNPRFILASFRRQIQQRIDTRFSDAGTNAMVSALLLADRSHLEAEIKEQFKQTGLGHLLAISGLHMGILAVFAHLGAWILIRRIPLRLEVKKSVAAFISLLIVASFAVIVGFSPSVFRSFAMTTLVTLASLSHRKTPTSRYLGIAFIVLLAFRPSDIGSLGFWLSFSAVGAILLLMGSLEDNHQNRGVIPSFKSSLFVSISAIIGTSPFLIWAFGSFPLVSIIVSPLGVFLLTVALPIILFSVLLPSSVISFSLVGKEVIQLLVSLAEWGNDVSFIKTISSPVHTLPEWILPMWCLSGLILFYKRPFASRLALSMWLFTALGYLFIPRHSVQMTFFDVGQGDAMMFSMANKGSVVVDLGPSNQAGKTVLNHIRSENIHENIHLVFSHGHVDHIGGSLSFLSNLSRRDNHDLNIVHSGWIPDTMPGAYQVKRGDQLMLDEAARVYVLHPNTSGFDNDSSIILLIKYGPTTILLAGDAEAGAEKRVIRDFAPLLTSVILKVGHHGSKTSSTPAFLDAVKPKQSIISAGIKNRFNHPNQEVVDRLANINSQIYLTGEVGAVQFFLGEHGIENIKTSAK